MLEMPDQNGVDEDLVHVRELLYEQINLTPRPGFLYPVMTGDTMPRVVKQALDSIGPSTDRMRQEYSWNIVSGRYNRETYGTPSSTKSYPSKYIAPGINLGIRVAFLPRNEDAIVAMRAGRLPRMTVDPRTGAPRVEGAKSRGLIWLPPVDESSFKAGIVTCKSHLWEDGSSTIDIDPELRSYLEAA